MKDFEKKQSTIIKEMEQIITGYLLEMKEENEIFLKELHKHDHKTDNPIDNSMVKLNEYKTEENNPFTTKKNNSEVKNERVAFDIKEDQISKLDLDSLLPSYEKGDNENIEKTIDTVKATINEKEMSATGSISRDDLYVQSLSAQAMLLQKKGDTIEQIAKKLGKGKTEIELLLKFRQN